MMRASAIGLAAVSIVLLGGACGDLASVPDPSEGGSPVEGGTPTSDGGTQSDAADPGTPRDSGPLGVAYRAAVLADMPLAYYRLDDDGLASATAVLLDEVSSQRVGTLKGTPGFSQPGAVGSAIRFDGSSWIELPSRVFPGVSPFTIELWMKAEGTTFAHVLTNQRRPPGRKDGWAVLSDTRVGFERYFNNLPEYTDKGLLRPLERFMHVAITYDGTRVRLVMDGAEVDSFPDVHEMPDHGALTVLGAASTSGELKFTGTVDEVAFYGRRLSDEALRAHIAAAAAP
jgi:hypothetical protein